MTITLHANQNRRSDRDPNATGNGLIDGRPILASAWTNTSQKGEKYQKISFTWADDRAKEITNDAMKHRDAPHQKIDDDIPF